MSDPKRIVDALLGNEDEDDEFKAVPAGEEVDWSPQPDDPDTHTAGAVERYAVENERMTWVKAHLEWEEYPELWCPKVTTFSDYSGGTVERSNSRVLDEKYDFIKTHGGGHGTTWAGISEEDILTISEDDWESFKEDVEKLEDYPLLDEDDHSQLEMELQNKAWDEWTRDDLKAHAVRADDDPLMKFTYASMTPDEWNEVRYELEQHGDGRFEWHDEHGTMYVNVERAYEAMDKDALPDYSVQFAAAQKQVWEDWLASFFEALLKRRSDTSHILATASLSDLWSLFTSMARRYEYELWDCDKDAELSVDKDSVRDMVETADASAFSRIQRPDSNRQLKLRLNREH